MPNKLLLFTAVCACKIIYTVSNLRLWSDTFTIQSSVWCSSTEPCRLTIHGLDWIEQGLTSPPTQYRLSGRQFYRSKDPTNSIKVLKIQIQRVTSSGLYWGTNCILMQIQFVQAGRWIGSRAACFKRPLLSVDVSYYETLTGTLESSFVPRNYAFVMSVNSVAAQSRPAFYICFLKFQSREVDANRKILLLPYEWANIFNTMLYDSACLKGPHG